jgi:hypothetical protein
MSDAASTDRSLLTSSTLNNSTFGSFDESDESDPGHVTAVKACERVLKEDVSGPMVVTYDGTSCYACCIPDRITPGGSVTIDTVESADAHHWRMARRGEHPRDEDPTLRFSELMELVKEPPYVTRFSAQNVKDDEVGIPRAELDRWGGYWLNVERLMQVKTALEQLLPGHPICVAIRNAEEKLYVCTYHWFDVL